MKQTRLMDIAGNQRPDVLSRYRFGGYLDRNRFGVVAVETSGTSTTPRSVTQLFLSGLGIFAKIMQYAPNFDARGDRCSPNRVVGIARCPLIGRKERSRYAPYLAVLSNYCDLPSKGMGIALPFTVVLGAVGLKDTYVGVDSSLDGPIHADRQALVKKYVDAILDLAGVTRA
jgi:hypothetical protein